MPYRPKPESSEREGVLHKGLRLVMEDAEITERAFTKDNTVPSYSFQEQVVNQLAEIKVALKDIQGKDLGSNSYLLDNILTQLEQLPQKLVPNAKYERETLDRINRMLSTI